MFLHYSYPSRDSIWSVWCLLSTQSKHKHTNVSTKIRGNQQITNTSSLSSLYLRLTSTIFSPHPSWWLYLRSWALPGMMLSQVQPPLFYVYCVFFSLLQFAWFGRFYPLWAFVIHLFHSCCPSVRRSSITILSPASFLFADPFLFESFCSNLVLFLSCLSLFGQPALQGMCWKSKENWKNKLVVAKQVHQMGLTWNFTSLFAPLFLLSFLCFSF